MRDADKYFRRKHQVEFRKFVKFMPQIQCFGLVTEMLNGMIIDRDYYLVLDPSVNSWFVCAKDDLSQPVPYGRASFYADCLAFDHDVATLAVPAAGSISHADVPWIFKPSDQQEEAMAYRDIPSLYLQCLYKAFDEAVEAGEGIWLKPAITYGDETEAIDFETRYAKFELAIHLYNAALRQSDLLSKYLHFYRVIENLSSGNGKELLKRILNTSLEYVSRTYSSFSNLHQTHPAQLIPSDVYEKVREDKLIETRKDFGLGTLINTIEVRRAEAIIRLTTLRVSMSDHEITQRLYNENRCGIAHGGTIKRHDLGNDFIELAKDLRLLRYLARLAIEDALS